MYCSDPKGRYVYKEDKSKDDDTFYIVCDTRWAVLKELKQLAIENYPSEVWYYDCGVQCGKPIPLPVYAIEVHVEHKKFDGLHIFMERYEL